MIDAIEISVLRVSSNGKHIEFIINCPSNYHFTDFTIQVYGSDDVYSLSDIFKDEEGYWKENVHHYSGQFEVTDVGAVNPDGTPKPEMYEIHLKMALNECDQTDHEETEEIDIAKLETIAYISDVSKVYSCLMNSILKLDKDKCPDDENMNELIRNYLILYAHQEAMRFRELTEAKKYFLLLQKCFSNCGNYNKECSTCGRPYTTYKPSNCGCIK